MALVSAKKDLIFAPGYCSRAKQTKTGPANCK